MEQMEEAPDPQDVGRGWQEQCPTGNSWPLQNDTFICPFLSVCTRLRARRCGIIYPLTYRLCLVYKQWLYKLLRKLSMKNNNNSPCSPPVVSTFGPLENPLGPQILPGKGWEGAKEMPGEGGPGTHHYPSSPAQLLPELDFIHIYIFLWHMFFFIHITTNIFYIYKETYFLYILYIFHTFICVRRSILFTYFPCIPYIFMYMKNREKIYFFIYTTYFLYIFLYREIDSLYKEIHKCMWRNIYKHTY